MSSKARSWAARVAVAMYLATALLLVQAEGSRAVAFTVTNTNDGGAGSLRQAILDANGRIGEDEIRFNIGQPPITIPDPDPTRIILLAFQLPDITDPVTIDATTQPGYVDRPLVEVRGPALPVPGLVLAGASTGSVVRGLSLTRFTVGVLLSSGGNALERNWIGVGVNAGAGPNVTGIQVSGKPTPWAPGT